MLTAADGERIDSRVIERLHAEHDDALRRFVWAVLRDHHLVDDVLQATFTKAVEQVHVVQPAAIKAWLFRVAYHEALAIRRRQAVQTKGNEQAAYRDDREPELPEALLGRRESVEAVRLALEQLPIEQREIVRLRIYEQEKFTTIAERLDLPLGTVLTRMRLALGKLRKALSRLDGDTP